MTIFFLPVTMISYATSLNLNCTSFDSNHPEIFKEFDTTVGNVGIELTMNLRDQKQGGSIGRATYREPLHLWDKASGNLTNFTTHFFLIIDSQGESELYSDGLTFLLVPNSSRAAPETIPGGNLALAINDSLALDSQESNFVAVEFDTYSNPWDPQTQGNHVGIDVRSMQSVATAPCLSNVMQGNRTYLPEWVTFGFSVSTGSLSQINRIRSWEFSSSSDIVDSVIISTPNIEQLQQKVEVIQDSWQD
ncbi:hypothetical protein P3X46_013590 [Hevea brasiliensis]|uniref:Legume lectin domain-containing protein n=1 Tax=Hevea brasiliensis TaxID=3981 RepID=A0ABQ9M5S9_HEVBR|nr:hypothetical protein P3X46_013590 [Hevea brasiliensis]